MPKQRQLNRRVDRVQFPDDDGAFAPEAFGAPQCIAVDLALIIPVQRDELRATTFEADLVPQHQLVPPLLGTLQRAGTMSGRTSAKLHDLVAEHRRSVQFDAPGPDVVEPVTVDRSFESVLGRGHTEAEPPVDGALRRGEYRCCQAFGGHGAQLCAHEGTKYPLPAVCGPGGHGQDCPHRHRGATGQREMPHEVGRRANDDPGVLNRPGPTPQVLDLVDRPMVVRLDGTKADRRRPLPAALLVWRNGAGVPLARSTVVVAHPAYRTVCGSSSPSTSSARFPTVDPMYLSGTLTIRYWRRSAPGSHPAEGDYAERFWLPVIGPSGLWLLRWAKRELQQRGGAFDIGSDDLALRLGLGAGTARQSPLRRSLKRLETFDLARRISESVVEVGTELPSLSHRQVERLPVELRREHRAWWVERSVGRSPDDLRSTQTVTN